MILKFTRVLFTSLLFSAVLYPTDTLAQSVSIKNGFEEYGFGWMFHHAGTCHVVMPRHVAGPFPRVTVTTSAPVASATARTFSPFWDEIDLAVGVVRGGLEDRCTWELDDFIETPRVASSVRGVLHRVTASGDLDRTEVQIMDRDYLNFEAEIDADGTEIAQGTSGAFVLAGDGLAGMSVTSEGTRSATFLRADEIYIHVSRFLGEANVSNGFVQEDLESSAARASGAVGGRVPLELREASVPPTNPMSPPESMTADGQFVFAPSRQMTFVFGTRSGDLAPISRLRITSDPDSGFAMPQQIIVRRSVAKLPQSFRTWSRGEVAKDGVFDTGAGVPINTRWIEVRIISTQGSGDIAIDEVSAFSESID
ncbi:hypothetical protein [Roseivivax marinus]|uniref:hypothetical protein n=1 Tax=Roseivivax marinus TaxID=1379903 RepID=UPI00273DD39D|nr:hypothetical protein [Roseivivax marinus]